MLKEVFAPLHVNHTINRNTIVLTKLVEEKKVAENDGRRQTIQQDKHQRRVKGVVVDDMGDPIVGATVKEKGSAVGTVTNIDGEFALDVAANAKLQISYIGFAPQEMSAEGDNLKVVLKEEVAQKLNEVVVVGYGKQKKASVTAAISTVTTKDLVQTPQANVSNMLVGKMPGLIATQRSGAPGEDASSLLVRGVSTFSDNTAPLVMIDGVERPNFNGVDPNEIESVSILKDASATAIYGVRGANGVVLITTRKGNVAIQQPTALPKYLNSADYATLYNEAQLNDSYTSGAVYTPRFSDADIELYRNGTDPVMHPNMNWVDDFLRGSSLRTQHNLNLSGGTDRVKYFISAGYFSQEGIYKNTKIDKDHDVNAHHSRYNFRSNLDFQITKDFTATLQLAAQIEDVAQPGLGNSGIWSAVSFANPLSSSGLVDGKIVHIQDGLGAANPWQQLLSNGYKKDSKNNLNTTFRLDYDLSRVLLKGLAVHASVSYDSYYYSRKNFYKGFPYYYARPDAADPSLIHYIPQLEETVWDTSTEYNKNRKLYMEAGIHYEQTFGKNHVTGLVLYNQSKYYAPSLQFLVPNAYQGLVGRVTYEYDSRYLAEFNMGYNGTENFAKGKRFGFFPAVSVGWVVSEEKFFPKNDWLVFMKLRATYGEVGNDKIGGDRFLYLPSSYGSAGDAALNRYYFGPSSSPIASLKIVENKIGNPDLTWEKAKKYNLGLEMNMLKNHLTFSFDVFKETRNNILANRSTQPVIIGANLPAYNLGEMENYGWELDLNYRNRIGDFNYWERFNYSFARNKVLFKDEINKQYPYQLETGRRNGQFFGLLTDGYYNSWEEVNALDRPVSAWSSNRLQPGDVKYIDVNKDGKIDNCDMVPLGYSNIPEVIYGFSFGGSWKNFDLSVLFQGADHVWIRDADYLRLKNLEVGYTFRQKFIKSMGIQSVRLYVSGSNLFTWTDVIDLDPEAPSRSGNVEINTYPLQKVYNIGLHVNF